MAPGCSPGPRGCVVRFGASRGFPATRTKPLGSTATRGGVGPIPAVPAESGETGLDQIRVTSDGAVRGNSKRSRTESPEHSPNWRVSGHSHDDRTGIFHTRKQRRTVGRGSAKTEVNGDEKKLRVEKLREDLLVSHSNHVVDGFLGPGTFIDNFHVRGSAPSQRLPVPGQ